jgi:hypothetical protein
MADPSEVKRVLARLADGESAAYPPLSRADDYRAVVDVAADAVDSLADTAAFVDGDGRQRLANAVDAAEAADDHPAARRGRQALAALDDLQAALEAREGDAAERSTTDTER